MTDARSLHCPNCGAAAEPAAARCPYCRARLAAISCPQCFALMFEGSAYCAACGAPAARAEQHASDAPCPGCRGTLHRVAVAAASLLECSTCDGVWLDAADFERMCGDRESRAAVLHRWTSADPRDAQQVRYRPCVRCGKMMNRVNFGRLSGTIVDVCRGHGTFLDSGELHAIVSFIDAGGLDRMREREIEDLKEEQRRLQELQRAEAYRTGDAPHAAGGWDSTSIAQLLSVLIER